MLSRICAVSVFLSFLACSVQKEMPSELASAKEAESMFATYLAVKDTEAFRSGWNALLDSEYKPPTLIPDKYTFNGVTFSNLISIVNKINANNKFKFSGKVKSFFGRSDVYRSSVTSGDLKLLQEYMHDVLIDASRPGVPSQVARKYKIEDIFRIANARFVMSSVIAASSQDKTKPTALNLVEQGPLEWLGNRVGDIVGDGYARISPAEFCKAMMDSCREEERSYEEAQHWRTKRIDKANSCKDKRPDGNKCTSRLANSQQHLTVDGCEGTWWICKCPEDRKHFECGEDNLDSNCKGMCRAEIASWFPDYATPNDPPIVPPKSQCISKIPKGCGESRNQ